MQILKKENKATKFEIEANLKAQSAALWSEAFLNDLKASTKTGSVSVFLHFERKSGVYSPSWISDKNIRAFRFLVLCSSVYDYFEKEEFSPFLRPVAEAELGRGDRKGHSVSLNWTVSVNITNFTFYRALEYFVYTNKEFSFICAFSNRLLIVHIFYMFAKDSWKCSFFIYFF